MSILIAYATKHGFTKKCAELLAEKLGEDPDIFDLDRARPDLNQYDKVIVGGAIYAGKICKPTALFCAGNLNALKGKKLGLFICGMLEDAQKQLESAFPSELLAAAIAREYLGGEFDFQKMNFFERFIIKKISGSDQNQTRLMEANISRFAELMKNA